jgi:hypothetical protein
MEERQYPENCTLMLYEETRESSTGKGKKSMQSCRHFSGGLSIWAGRNASALKSGKDGAASSHSFFSNVMHVEQLPKVTRMGMPHTSRARLRFAEQKTAPYSGGVSAQN